MVRRVSFPSAEELFRSTDDDDHALESSDPARRVHALPAPSAQLELERQAGASGRVRHDEKMTVYVTSDELVAIEEARLTLRRDHGLAVDRGRLVREAIHLALDGLEAEGDASALVRRLDEQG